MFSRQGSATLQASASQSLVQSRLRTGHSASLSSFRSKCSSASLVQQEAYKRGVKDVSQAQEEQEFLQAEQEQEKLQHFGLLRVSKNTAMALGVLATVFHSGLIFGATAFQNQLVKVGSPFTELTVSQVFAVGHIITAGGGIASGLVLDKCGPRACAVSGLLIEAIGLAFLSAAQSLAPWITILAYGLVGLGGVQVMMASLTLAEVFERASLAASVLTGAFNLGGMIFMLLPYVDWVTFFVGYAAFALATAFVLAAVFPKDAPAGFEEDEGPVSDMAELGAGMRTRTLRQVLLQPGVVLFLLTFMVSGSVLVYEISVFNLALQVKDDCTWTGEKFVDCARAGTADSLSNIWMPFIGNLIFPTALVFGFLVDKWGFALPAALNIAFAQLLAAALWLLPFDSQLLTVFAYNFAQAAVYAMQNAYVCAEGYNHVGVLYGVTNLAMTTGNFLAEWFAKSPFGELAEDQAKTSLDVSSVVWVLACCPLYVWPVYELLRSRRERQALAKLEQPSAPLLPSLPLEPAEAKPSAQPLLPEPGAQVNALRPVDHVEQPEPNSRPEAPEKAKEPKTHAEEPQWSKVVTVNPESWALKTKNLLTAGPDACFFVMDFDRTITKCFLETGAKSLDCHDILASCPKITAECKRTMELLMDKYYPIEIHAQMTREEKIPHMVEWYKLVNQLLMDQGLTRSDVQQAVADCPDFRLRTGVQEVFHIAEQRGIPIVVLSAGLGNIIEEVLVQRMPHSDGSLNKPWPNVRVLSNTLLWTGSGQHRGFTEPLIHMFNKGLGDAPEDLKALVQGRRQAVLCGDGLGDLTMASGHEVDNLLKFGFLNEKIDERLEQYCREDGFDRVVLGDGTYEPLLEVLRKL